MTPTPPQGSIAAILARKSTFQKGVIEKSVGVQIDEGTRCADRHGWTIPNEFIYSDDGISGAEFERRTDFMRMIAEATSGALAPFQVLIINEDSRFGREQLETGYWMKQLDEAGVVIWSCLDDAAIDLDDPTGVAMMQLKGFASTMQRVVTSKKVQNRMRGIARGGGVTGSRPYGIEHVRLYDSEGRAGRVVRQDHPTEGPVLHRIFERAAAGAGKQRICVELNLDGIRAKRGGLWAPNTIGAILGNPIYCGRLEYGRTSPKSKWGKKRKNGIQPQPRATWITAEAAFIGKPPISVEVWEAAQAHRAARYASRKAHGGPQGGRLRDGQSNYLLTGLAVCSICGGPITAIHRPPCVGQTKRYRAYACGNYHRGGRHRCTNATTVEVGRFEAAVLEALLANPIRDIARRLTDAVLEMDARRRSRADVGKQRERVEKLEKQVANYRRAIGAGADGIEGVVETGLARQRELDEARRVLEALERPVARSARLTRPALMERFSRELRQWAEVLGRDDMAAKRDLLRQHLDGKILVTPAPDVVPVTKRSRNARGPRKDCRAFRFEGQRTLGPLLSGLATSGVQDTAFADGCKLKFLGIAA